MEEKWIVSKTLKGFYEVSSLGNIRRIKPGKNARVGCNRKFTKSNNGYLSVVVHVDKVPITVHMHRLVAIEFLGPPGFTGAQVNHKNGIKTDNRIRNLEWVTQSQNMKHAKKVLGWTGRPGVPVLQIDAKGHIVREFASAKEAADSMDGKKSTRSCISVVCSFIRRKLYKKVFHKNFVWMYKSDFSPKRFNEAVSHLHFMKNKEERM